jgi:hypothetical protein
VTSVLQIPADELVEAVEEAVARGDAGADRMLGQLLDQLLETGGLSVILRLAASRYMDAVSLA